MNGLHKKSVATITRFILLIPIFAFLFSCSTQSPGGYGFTTQQFARLGWVKVNSEEVGENTVYNRITYEQSKSSVMMLILEHGFPDYYKAVDVGEVYYGYASTGDIYHFTDYFSDVEKFNYSKLGDSIPLFMFKGFKGN